MNHDLHTGRPERRPVGTIAFPDGADFAPEMTPAQVGAYSTLALAHIGDGVYELMMRTALCAAGLTAVRIMSSYTPSPMCARASVL